MVNLRQGAIACSLILLGTLPFRTAGASGGGAATTGAPRDGAALLLHYPGIRAVRDNAVIFSDGTSLPYDDGREKSLAAKLEAPSIRDHFTHPYPALAPIMAPAPDEDPGRFRNDPLFRKLYGVSRSAIEKNLVTVRWLPRHGDKRILFNGNQQAAAQLQKVSDELDRLPEEDLRCLRHLGGTYSFRKIAGTDRLSAHSYGIAIDIDTRHSSYWQWDKEQRYRNDIPQKIVEIFERHGFVWGGRWYHYDTMHFEYRPELFAQLS